MPQCTQQAKIAWGVREFSGVSDLGGRGGTILRDFSFASAISASIVKHCQHPPTANPEYATGIDSMISIMYVFPHISKVSDC